MNPKRLSLVVALYLLTGPAARAATPITIGEMVKIQSKVMGEERKVLISLPDAYYRGNNARFPVLYLTDGDGHLMHTRGTADFLAQVGLMPNMIIVGVTNTDRTRDLTPSRADFQNPDGSLTRFATSGGGDRFLDFFEKELIPYVEANYRTLPYRIFCGHSFGGLFAVHAFLTRPDLFNAVVATSPTLFWDKDLELKRARTFFADRKTLSRTFFVSMGKEGAAMDTSFEAFRKILASDTAAGFRWGSMTFPDEDHGSVVLRSHYYALRKIFEGWRMPRDQESGNYTASLEEMKKHYAGLSDRFGWKLLPPEVTVNLIGYQALQKKDTARALEFFRYNVANYSDSANVYDSQGDGLEAAGKLDEALASYTKAAELGEKSGDPNTDAFKKNAERLREKLGKAAPSAK